jgi:DNA-binding transcriptional regulator of glucitol operon
VRWLERHRSGGRPSILEHVPPGLDKTTTTTKTPGPQPPTETPRRLKLKLTGRGVSVGTVNGRLLARRAGIIALCVLSLVACVGLAWWQWERFESTTGTWQNLGYVLQWPLFGLFPAFMFWRLRKLHAQQRSGSAPGPEPEPEPAPVRPRPARQDEDDPELAAYNHYLAQLNAMDQETR